jgi:hypothetical protein
MPIFLDINSQRLIAVELDLQRICPDPGLAVLPNGRVDYKQTMSSVGCQLVAELTATPCRVLVRGESADFSYQAHAGALLADARGVTVPDKYPGTTSVEVLYDATDCNGKGAWVLAQNGDPIPEWRHTLLFHELTHANRYCHGDTPVLSPDAGIAEIDDLRDEEQLATIREENRYRQSMFLTLRATTFAFFNSGGCNPPPASATSGDKPKTLREMYSKSGCFVASAAYGSALDPNVEQLRRFRDDVLCKTRAGAKFFEDFYGPYYELSPVIVEMMRADPHVRELVRWAIVTPIVNQLRLGLRFPDAPLEGVPEPWRSFLDETRDSLQRWAEAIDLPCEFAGVSATDAAEEINVVLTYLLRTESARSAYLDRLTELGEIPLRAKGAEIQQIAARFTTEGRSEAEIVRVLGPVRPAPDASEQG